MKIAQFMLIVLVLVLSACTSIRRKLDQHYVEPATEKQFTPCGTADKPCIPVKGADDIVWYEEGGDVICSSARICWILHDQVTPERYEYLLLIYRKPYYDSREKRLFRHRILADTLDVVSTRRGLRHGCLEGNPLFGKNPSTPKMVMMKILFVIPMRWDMHNSPMRWSSADAWQYKAQVGLTYAAAGWNTYAVNAGLCGR